MVIFGTFCGQLLEITLFAAAYYYLRDRFDLGTFGGYFADRFPSYLYFSAGAYTSIGMGDIYPPQAICAC